MTSWNKRIALDIWSGGRSHHGPGSLPAPPGQHVTRPQTLWPPSPCFNFLGVRDCLLATLHFLLSTVSGAENLRCPCQQDYQVEFPMGDIHETLIGQRGRETSFTLPLNGKQELRPWQLTVMRLAWQPPGIILLTAHSDVESNQLRSSAGTPRFQPALPSWMLVCLPLGLSTGLQALVACIQSPPIEIPEWLLSSAEPN